MGKLIFVNGIGKNENRYIIGSNIGSQSRFVRSALKQRASKSSSGQCCFLNYINYLLISD